MTKFNPAQTAKLIKAHIAKAAGYDEKARQNEVSAALYLIQAKAELPHGQYMPWLKEHDIAPRTASRLIAEHVDPAKRAARMTKQNEKGKKDRAKAAKAEAKEAKAEADPIRTEVLRIIGGLDAMGIEDIHQFLQEQGYANAPEMDEDMDINDAADEAAYDDFMDANAA